MRVFRYFVLLIICSLIISACSNNGTSCPDEGHPHLIDLGLPNGTKWACCNVGANSPEDIGGYYAWGETRVKSTYDDIHYQHGEVSNQIPQRMRDIAGSKYDAAVASMGLSYAMPTSEQWKELIDYCKWEWVKYKGHHGWRITGPNGNQIFLPAGGMKGGENVYKVDEFGYYWTSEYDVHDGSPYSFYTNGGCRVIRPGGSYRTYGFNVRAVGRQQ